MNNEFDHLAIVRKNSIPIKKLVVPLGAFILFVCLAAWKFFDFNQRLALLEAHNQSRIEISKIDMNDIFQHKERLATLETYRNSSLESYQRILNFHWMLLGDLIENRNRLESLETYWNSSIEASQKEFKKLTQHKERLTILGAYWNSSLMEIQYQMRKLVEITNNFDLKMKHLESTVMVNHTPNILDAKQQLILLDKKIQKLNETVVKLDGYTYEYSVYYSILLCILSLLLF